MRRLRFKPTGKLGFAAGCLTALLAWGGDENPLQSLGGDATGLDRTQLAAVESLVRRATGDPRRAAEVELQLLVVLQSEASLETKQFVCRQLRLVGAETSAPVLGRLLSDPQLAHLARSALEPMPSFSAGAALRQALQTTRGELLVGVVNSLGERREPASVPALLPLLKARDVAVVQAAVCALGKIGGDSAFDALRAVARPYDPTLAEGVSLQVDLSEDVRRRLDVTVLFDALLTCAAGFDRDGQAERVSETYARMYAAAAVPRPQQIAALTGLTRGAPDRAAPLILNLLRGRDASLQAVAADLARQLPAASTAPIIALLDALPVVARALVIEALSDRADPTLLFPLLKASLSPDAAVRVAALRALAAQEGNRETVQLLLGVAGAETADSPVARASLDRLRGPEVETNLIAQLEQSRVAMRVEAARCLGARRVQAAVPRLVKALGDANAPVRFAALESLGQLGGKEELALLLSHLTGAAAAPEQEVAAKAVLAVARRVATTAPQAARAAMEKVLATVIAEPVQTEARQTLDSFGPGKN